jgi:hypothetical protein
MKNPFIGRILPVILLTFFCFTLHAQQVIVQESCDIKSYLTEIDSLKTFFSSKGFIVLKEASMSMESAYEMPIIVPMTQGSLYEFVFIGDPSSRLYEVRMYDWDENQVVYQKKLWGDVDGNIISYAYIPEVSQYHMIKPVQVNKFKKKLCGYVMLLKKVR